MIDFSLLNGVVNVSADGVFYKGFQQSSDNTSDFNVDSNEAIITLDGQPFVIPLASLTISGVAVSNQADFETKISVILNNVTSSIQGAIDAAKVFVNVKDFGAKGNGVADDTAAIQNSVNSLSNGGTIVFPSGTYKTSGTITIASTKTKIKFHRAILQPTLNTFNVINIQYDECEVDGAIIIGNGADSGDFYLGVGIGLFAVKKCVVRNCNISAVGSTGIYLGSSGGNGCEDCLIENNIFVAGAAAFNESCGILLGYSGTGYLHKSITIKGNNIFGNYITGYGIAAITHCTDIKILDNKIDSCSSYGIVLYESGTSPYSVYKNIVSRNTVLNIGSYGGIATAKGMGIYLLACHDSIVSDNIVQNVLINNDGIDTLSRGAIALGGTVGCSVHGNKIFQSNRHGISVAESFETSIKNNTIEASSSCGIKILNSNDATISGNTIINTVDQGIYGSFYVSSSDNLTGYQSIPTGKGLIVSGNNIKQTADIGILLMGFNDSYPIENALIDNNIITPNSNRTHIQLLRIKHSAVRNNILNCLDNIGQISVGYDVSDDVNISGNKFNSPVPISIVVISVEGNNHLITNNTIPAATNYIYYKAQNFKPDNFVGTLPNAPIGGAWLVGDKVFNNVPSAGSYAGWVCVVAGTPGTWKGFGLIEA